MVLVAGLFVLAIASVQSVVFSDEGQVTQGDKTPAKVQRKQRQKPLPRYFTRVVTPPQRAAIHKIQAKYQPQLEKLRAEIAAIEKAQEKESWAILSAEQQQQVKLLRKEAKQRREERLQNRRQEKLSTEKPK